VNWKLIPSLGELDHLLTLDREPRGRDGLADLDILEKSHERIVSHTPTEGILTCRTDVLVLEQSLAASPTWDMYLRFSIVTAHAPVDATDRWATLIAEAGITYDDLEPSALWNDEWSWQPNGHKPDPCRRCEKPDIVYLRKRCPCTEGSSDAELFADDVRNGTLPNGLMLRLLDLASERLAGRAEATA
jgi:hypothetical protein